jgi:O-antigen ligase
VTSRAVFDKLAGLMNREILDKWCERGILALVLGILVFGPLAMGAVDTLEFLVLQGLTMGVMLLWGARLWLNPRPQLLWPPICWAVVAFAVYAIIRYLTADIEYVARLEMVRVLIYAFLFFAILNNLHRQEPAQLISFTLVFLAMGISFYAIYQYVTDSDKVWQSIRLYKHRASGTYISPNSLGGFLEMILPLGLAYTLVSRAKPLTKVFVGYASLVIPAGIAVTVSRGSWISAGLAMVVFFVVLLFHRTYRLPLLALLVLILGVGFFLVPRSYFFHARIKQLFMENKVDDDQRFTLWKPAVQLWEENIWWGVGPGHFDFRYRAYRPETLQAQAGYVHNDFLNTLTDWGIAGAAFVTSAWVLLYAGAFKTWRFVRKPDSDFGGRMSSKLALVLGASVGLLAILFHSAVDFNMHIPANAILAVTLMALLSGCLRFATGRYWIGIGFGARAALTLTLLAGLGYLGWQGAREAHENVWLDKARRLQQTVPIPMAALGATLEKAFAAEPMNFETAYWIGEAYRMQSWEGTGDYRELAEKAMDWFERGIKINPYDGYNFMRYGMCLDWLGRHAEAKSYFDRAVQLDPNGYFTAAHMGWHYVQVENYAAARAWFERSKRLESEDNPIAASYLQIVTQKLFENATNSSPANSELLAR